MTTNNIIYLAMILVRLNPLPLAIGDGSYSINKNMLRKQKKNDKYVTTF